MEPIIVEPRRLAELKLNPCNARTHSKKQTRQIERSITEFGFVNPILIDEDDVLIAGHGRLAAAKNIGIENVPAIKLAGLDPSQKRALALADNKIAANAGWDRDILAVELNQLITEGYDVAITGFEAPEIDQIILDHEDNSADPADDVPGIEGPPVTKRGDLWCLGNHRLMCGDAREAADVAVLCGDDRAGMGFFDAPYNVPVSSIGGRGRTKHPEFAMGSGEMSDDQFMGLLGDTHRNAVNFSRDGAVHYSCMDWRSIDKLMTMGRTVYGQTLNIIAWVKSNAGQGSFYRSQHEFIAVFRVGDAPNLNNVELGKHGRSRSNVWHYAGVNSFGRGRMADLSSHPTVKPVALIADAMKDCTRRGEYVLDLFGGSGSTLMAAERVGRRALLLEYEPRYVDVTIRRWQAFTRKDAIHVSTGLTFDDIAASTTGGNS